MNLDDFKYKINQQLEVNSNFEMPANNFLHFENSKTNTILTKIKNSLKFEIFIGILITTFLTWLYFHFIQTSISIYFGVFSIITVINIFILSKLFYLTNKILKNNSNNVKTNLRQLHILLKNFIRKCFQFTMLLIPICFATATFLTYNDIQFEKGIFNKEFDVPFPKHLIFILSALVIGFTIFMYFFTKWYLQKMYGIHLTQLQQMLNELDEE